MKEIKIDITETKFNGAWGNFCRGFLFGHLQMLVLRSVKLFFQFKPFANWCSLLLVCCFLVS